MRYDESVVKEVPSVGAALHEYMTRYYRFHSHVAEAEESLLLKIGTMSICAFAQSWRLYLRYALLRFAGASQQDIMGWGNFLNYGITWVEAERVYVELGRDLTIAPLMASLLESHKQLSDDLQSLVTTITAGANQALPADPPPKTAVGC